MSARQLNRLAKAKGIDHLLGGALNEESDASEGTDDSEEEEHFSRGGVISASVSVFRIYTCGPVVRPRADQLARLLPLPAAPAVKAEITLPYPSSSNHRPALFISVQQSYRGCPCGPTAVQFTLLGCLYLYVQPRKDQIRRIVPKNQKMADFYLDR